MSTPIKSGELIEASCPENSTPELRVGEFIPRGSEALVVVTKIKGGQIWLGPLKAGPLALDLPCTNNTKINIDTEIVGLKKEELPPEAPPLPLLNYTYSPYFLWGAIFFVLLVGLLSAFFVRRAWIKRKLRLLSKKDTAVKIPPPEALQLFLQECARRPPRDTDDMGSIDAFYTQANERLRSFLEWRLSFSAPWATTIEFLGEIRARLNSVGPEGAELSRQVEQLLVSADTIRFSKIQASAESRTKHLDQMKYIFQILKRGTESS